MDDAGAMTLGAAFQEWEQASGPLPAYQRHRETVKEWHNAPSSHEWSLAEVREQRRVPYRLNVPTLNDIPGGSWWQQ